jgi:hypothetical protein
MGLAEFINRVNRLRHRMYKHNLWTKDSTDEMLNDKIFGPLDLILWESCFKED